MTEGRTFRTESGDLSAATSKQRQVLLALIRHGSIKQAAKALGINANTARTRLSYMYRICGVKSAAEAAYLLGLEHRLN